ncbi:GNAT family N-acetyltransferase [Aeromicrobium massiliense]|uniref:GNAT family N-acetyltransferase n=1 Tax=Aeromicrobium massiliense TaxID=1464554 RepID=UPI0002F4A5A7|nr:GNAT family N-acetyltransferase [Aeromicrobium massiliense]
MSVRSATASDVPAIWAIHNEAVAHSTAIWDETPVDLADREAWFAERTAAGYPVLVAERDGVVGGYATYGPWRPKTGYRHTVENSVYVHPGHQGHGLASALLDALVAQAHGADAVHRVVAMIEATNTLSIGLHERRGFREVGRMSEVGTKFGRWLDLAILQLDC